MSERNDKPAKRAPAVLIAVILSAGLVSGCSSTPDWANPVEWYKGTRDWIAGDDPQAAEARARDAEKRGQAAGASAPNLATVPERPKPVGVGGDAKSVERGLVADRSQARHAALGPGDNAMNRIDLGAPPPAPVAEAPPPPPQSAAAEPAPAPPSAPPRPYSPARKDAMADPTPQPMADAPPALAPPPSPIPAAAGGTGVRETYQAAIDQSAPVIPVPSSILDSGPVPMTTQRNTMPLPPLPRGSMVLKPPPGATPASAIGGGAVAPSASVQVGRILFENGSSQLSKDDLKVLEKIIELKKERGGIIRVVGHASSRTRNVDPLHHRLVNFRLSLARANAVARQLIKLGVPADDVQVQARSDNEPVYYEFMPAGEAGNRRAEIYLDY